LTPNKECRPGESGGIYSSILQVKVAHLPIKFKLNFSSDRSVIYNRSYKKESGQSRDWPDGTKRYGFV
jgi:hypothetical protein